MSLPERYGVDKKINSMEGLSAYENGGPGSGNFGHDGRPGLIGGSGGRGIGAASLHESKQKVGSVEKEAKEAEMASQREASYSAVMNPTDKLDAKTLDEGRQVINDKMHKADADIRAGKVSPTVDGKPYTPHNEDLAKNGKTLATPLDDDASYDVLLSVQGQLSDGIWENSPSMESYWRMCRPFKADDGKVYLKTSKQMQYRDYVDSRGYNHWKNNKYSEMTNAGVRNFWGNKVKQVVDIERRDSKTSSLFKGNEDYSWSPNNKTELQYMHSYKEGGKNPTVGDAYKVWAKMVAPQSAKLRRGYGEDDE